MSDFSPSNVCAFSFCPLPLYVCRTCVCQLSVCDIPDDPRVCSKTHECRRIQYIYMSYLDKHRLFFMDMIKG